MKELDQVEKRSGVNKSLLIVQPIEANDHVLETP